MQQNNNNQKEGYKTTEFWLSSIAAIVGLVMAAGVLEDTSTVSRVVGLIATALTAMGYSVSRGKAKSGK